jgi:hypothetical protein
MGLSYTGVELHEVSVKWGSVARGFSYTTVQLHRGYVAQGFSCTVVKLQGGSVTVVQLLGVQLHGGSVVMEPKF